MILGTGIRLILDRRPDNISLTLSSAECTDNTVILLREPGSITLILGRVHRYDTDPSQK